jgi:glycosyltransferase involved in cell wall biosynthesis
MDVSVIITTYNRLPKLKMALASVNAQLNADFEIIIVDDGSTDGTKEFLQSLSQPNLKFHIKRYNRGLANSRNIGVEMATRKLVAFLDDDDIWLDPLKLNKQVKLFQPKCINCTSVQINQKVVTPKLPENWKRRLVYRNGFLHTSTIMLERHSIISIGGYDEFLTKGIDSDLFRRLVFLNNYGVHHIPEVTARYEANATDRITSNASNKKKLRQYFERIYQLIKYRYLLFRHPFEYLKRIYVSLTVF